MTTSHSDPLAAFAAAIAGAGLPAPAVIQADGTLHRYGDPEHPGDRDSLWYILYDGTVPAGAYGSWRLGFSETWCAKRKSDMSRNERQEIIRRMKTAQASREAEKEKRQTAVAEKALRVWDAAELAVNHPYLTKKKAQPHGTRIHSDGRLLIPLYNGTSKLSSLQFIDDDGSKLFLSGGKTQECYYLIEGNLATIYITEGFATASSIAQATESAVAVCFTAAQMLPIARLMNEKFPNAKLVICADNDVRDDDTPNTGLEAATEAATALSALLAVPELNGQKADFNDLYCELGLDAVRERLALAALTEQTLFEADLQRLHELGPVRYDQARKQLAKRLGVSAGSIDKEIKLRKQQVAEDEENGAIEALFEPIEPYDGEVNGRELVSAICKAIQRYVVLPDHEATAAALWVIHSHAVEAAYIAPILLLKSPQKRCGKSTLLDVLRSLVYRGLMVNSVSTAVVYRTMDIFKPTLLIDEADAFLDLNEELRGIINGGHSRSTAKTLRIGGANRDKVEVFDSFGPKAIAGIGKRRDTIIDRSIQINMRRRRPNESVEPLRQDRLDNRQLQSFCSAWTAAHLDALRNADPPVPDTLHDRAADNWRPLLAIADLCGFGTEARRAAMKLTSSDDDDNAGVMILEDLQRMFAEEDVDRLASSLVVERLGDMEDRPWSEWGRSRKPITPRQLAKLLEPFQIKPKTIRINTSTVKGYLRKSFEDAFSRYLPNSTDVAVTASHSSSDAASRDSQTVTKAGSVSDATVTGTGNVTDAKQPKPKNGAGCDGVSDKSAGLDGRKKKTDDSDEDLTWTEF